MCKCVVEYTGQSVFDQLWKKTLACFADKDGLWRGFKSKEAKNTHQKNFEEVSTEG